MSWILDGQKVKANYLGVIVSGIVTDSRVKYGGKVQYTVKLNEPVKLPWRSESKDIVLIDNDEVIGV